MTIFNTENLVTVPIPVTPTVTDSIDYWNVYLRAVSINNDIILRSNWAQAQQNTADAMIRAATAQEKLLAAYVEPQPTYKPTKAQLVWEAVKALPEVTGLSDLNMTDIAKGKVEDYLKRFPEAIDV